MTKPAVTEDTPTRIQAVSLLRNLDVSVLREIGLKMDLATAKRSTVRKATLVEVIANKIHADPEAMAGVEARIRDAGDAAADKPEAVEEAPAPKRSRRKVPAAVVVADADGEQVIGHPDTVALLQRVDAVADAPFTPPAAPAPVRVLHVLAPPKDAAGTDPVAFMSAEEAAAENARRLEGDALAWRPVTPEEDAAARARVATVRKVEKTKEAMERALPKGRGKKTGKGKGKGKGANKKPAGERKKLTPEERRQAAADRAQRARDKKRKELEGMSPAEREAALQAKREADKKRAKNYRKNLKKDPVRMEEHNRARRERSGTGARSTVLTFTPQEFKALRPVTVGKVAEGVRVALSAGNVATVLRQGTGSTEVRLDGSGVVTRWSQGTQVAVLPAEGTVPEAFAAVKLQAAAALAGKGGKGGRKGDK